MREARRCRTTCTAIRRLRSHSRTNRRATSGSANRSSKAIARSAGSYVQIVGRDQDYVILRLSTTEQRLVHGRCMATVGAVSNPDNMNTTIGKAGRQRWRGRMPHNRGITMNPVDHPHGGRTKGGKNWVTPWGFPTKGKKTRKNKRTERFIVASRHDRKKKQQ